MCKYCKINEDGNSDDAISDLGEIEINGVNVASLCFFADNKELSLGSDLKENCHKIQINYCPMCGRNLNEEQKNKSMRNNTGCKSNC